MRLLELEIYNVRGIPHLLMKPDGKNFVVWGPNGSGKSAVVDAIDFLLTGQISRLTGKGTGGITLNKHGPHIDHEPEEAAVRAIVQLPGLEHPVEIKRCLAHPNDLECDKTMTPQLEAIMTLAKRGQHVLTRRDILKYIISDAGTRAQEIQELLNISEIEEIRKALVKVKNDLAKDREGAEEVVERTKAAVNATTQEGSFNRDVVLQVVNQSRAVLSGQPISILHSTDLKVGLTPPTVISGDQAVNVTLLERDIGNLHNVTSAQGQEQIAQSDEQLRRSITDIRSDPQLLRALSRQQLTELGIKLIDETGSCPLCDKPWPPGELRTYLEQRLSTAYLVSEHQERIAKLSATITAPVNNTIASIQKVVGAAQAMNLKDELSLLQTWLSDLQAVSSALSDAVERYPDARFGSDQVKRMLAPDNLVESLKRIHEAAKAKYAAPTPEQTAWDTLTRLEENLKALESAETSFEKAELFQRRASVLRDSFISARDNVLGKLYDGIRDRFVDLYRHLHELDEGKFTANIKPEEAGLGFEVDFYGRGIYPPHALHSEGHQDSMGLCLYLALAERLTEGLIDLIILDDVVMSVDADHRRDVCHLLATSFRSKQFLITTHDKTWANQLKNEGVVDSRGTVEFYNWHVETGPQVNYEVDMWERIKEDLQKNDVPSAAAKLRRGSEEFFCMVCDSLRAPVICKLNGQWELGDLLPAAMSQYRELQKQAKRSANSWNDRDCLEMLNEVGSTASTIFARTQAEQWAVNANVHYNSWTNFSEKDFRPVVEAFQDLYGLFICSKCGGILHLSTTGTTPGAIRCNCGKVNWNLVEKGNAN